MDMTGKELKAARILAENKLYADVYSDPELPLVCVYIEWGDWKHEHARAKYLLEQAGFKYVTTEVTEEDGSDTYSAEHFFI